MRKPEILFVPAPKTPRLSRECWITEKLDGCWSAVVIGDSGEIFAASRNRWITPEEDNFGFARWVEGNKSELIKLGPGRHPGEWFGCGIQRHYNLSERRFALFNAGRWANPESLETPPACCSVVPVIYRGIFSSLEVDAAMQRLKDNGSFAAPGFLNPEGVIVYHVAAGIGFKKTLDGDATKGPAAQSPS